MSMFMKAAASGLLVMALLLYGSSRAHAQRARAVPSVVAIDAKGKVIGHVLRTDPALHHVQVALEVDGELIILQVTKRSFTASRSLVYYENEICKEPGFLAAMSDRSPFGPPVAVSGPNRTLYFGYLGTEELRLIRSFLTEKGCERMPGEAVHLKVLDASPMLVLTKEFKPLYNIVAPRSQRVRR